MEISGKVSQVLPVETGQGKNGEWKKQLIILKYMDGTYEKEMALEFFGKPVDDNLVKIIPAKVGIAVC